MCVELDVVDSPKHQVLIQSSLSEQQIAITVEYEWKPSRCPKCCVFGHICKEATATSKTTQVYVPVATQTFQEATTSEKCHTPIPVAASTPNPAPISEDTPVLPLVALLSATPNPAPTSEDTPVLPLVAFPTPSAAASHLNDRVDY